MSTEAQLWSRLKAGDEEARVELIERHLGLVHHAARRIAARLPELVELDDLVSAGTLGLMSSVECFEPDRGLAFSTFATPRVRGAILDELRSVDWVPRSVRSRSRQVRAVEESIERRFGRRAARNEIAAVLDLETETLSRWIDDAENAVQVPFDEPLRGTSESFTLEETVADQHSPSPDGWIPAVDHVDALRGALGSLPPKERAVLALYYAEDLSLRQIAEVMELTESRISQIRSKALNILRKRLPVPATGRSNQPGRAA